MRAAFGIAFAVTALTAAVPPLAAQPSLYEVEPNDTPADATRFSGELVLVGTMQGDDQDAFEWSVSDADAAKRWTFQLEGVPGRLTVVEVMRVEYAENGVDVRTVRRFFKMGSRDGSVPAVAEDLIFEPGEYLLGLAGAGGSGGAYRPVVDSVSFGAEGQTESAAEDTPGGYRLTVRHGSKLSPSSTRVPGASRAEARSLRLGSEAAAYVETPASWYRLEIDTKAAEKNWEIGAQVPVGRRVEAILHRANGSELARSRSDDRGQLALPDLGLAAGSYTLELNGDEAGYLRAVATTPIGVRVDGAEAEPNDGWALANRVDPTQPVTGRMGKKAESDFFRFTLGADSADQRLLLALESASEDSFTVELLDDRGRVLQARTGTGRVELPDLVLEPGDWGFTVERGAEGAEYSVTLAPQDAIAPGVEVEPNDRIAQAVAISANNRIKGRFAGDDTDFYKFLITDEAQLWRFQAIGDGIRELAYHDGAGVQSQNYRLPVGQGRARLDNLYLLPGTHYVRVSGRAGGGGSYTLLGRPIGPPDPNGEREPNDDTTRMHPLRFGQTRTGLLHDLQDSDNYRFHLAHWDRIRLTIAPPPDGEINANLSWGASGFKQFNDPKPGKPVVLEGLFPPGDYRLELETKTPSDAEYRLSLERLERFGCAVDCEPNDNPDMASSFPPDGVLVGRVNTWRDPDWFALPSFDAPTEIVIASEVRMNVKVVTREYGAKSMVAWDAETSSWRGTLTPGLPIYVQISGGRNQDYRLAVGFPDPPASVPTAPALDVGLALEADEVAAYRRFGQRVAGEMRLTNTGSAPVSVELEAATSDFRWRVELARDAATVAAGASTAVPLVLLVPADAWADRPVRVSVRALASGGGQREAFAEVGVGRDTAPVNAFRWWALPEKLLGGFNVAWSALGGRWNGEEDSSVGRGFPYLLDGMAVEGQAISLRGGTEVQTIDVEVELAGAGPVEVAGFALNPMSGRSPERFLRNVDLSLSLDGTTYTPVVLDELVPIVDEQAFVLDEPVAARFARISLSTSFQGSAKPPLQLGELKVIARPGQDPSGGKGFNLAAPELGGHVVWSRPNLTAAGWDTSVLVPDDAPRSLRFKGRQQDIILGFHHDRAAQLARIEWVEGPGGAQRFSRVALAASLDSPVGPWQPIGVIDLADTRPGSTAVLELETPEWARFLKLSALRDADSGVVLAPAQIRIWERPTEAQYRSILTEWGWASQESIYEHLQPLRAEEEFQVSGNNSRVMAQLLPLGKRVRGRVSLGREEDWYGVVMPEGDNTLTLSLGGEPTVRTVVAVESEAGDSVPVRRLEGSATPSLHVYEAVVEPGGIYFVKVEEPPRNVVFLWDTSASVGAYLPIIYNSLIAYSEDLVPGRDAANLMPFGGQLLLREWYGEPYILQTVVNDYPRNESSSAAEATLARAAQKLRPRAGTKAIVMVTDAATNFHSAVWNELDEVRPRVFTLGVASTGALGRLPTREQDLMQDWSRVNGGHYAHLKSEGEMEIGFDRAATLLRRPAPYTLEAASAYREAPGPGTLNVVSGDEGPIAAGGAVELILDASGSMLKRLEGKRRIAIAKDVLAEVVTSHLPAGTPMALRVFGHQEPNACRTDLEIPLGPLDPAAAVRTIEAVNAKNLAKTPIADSLAEVASDLAGAEGRKLVVLVTDGEETCDGDPEAVIQALQDQGVDVRLNIVGFAIGEGELSEQFATWAELGGGRYFSAESQSDLNAAVAEAMTVPYTVYDPVGTKVAEGTVDGEPVELEAGFYRVVVEGERTRTYDRVEVLGEQEAVLEVEEVGSSPR